MVATPGCRKPRFEQWSVPETKQAVRESLRKDRLRKHWSLASVTGWRMALPEARGQGGVPMMRPRGICHPDVCHHGANYQYSSQADEPAASDRGEEGCAGWGRRLRGRGCE